MRVFENSEQYQRDFVHVSQVVDTHIKFFNVPESGVWNVGTGKTKSFQMVGEEIAKEYNVDIEYIPMPTNLKHSYQEYTCADMSKTYQMLQKSHIIT